MAASIAEKIISNIKDGAFKSWLESLLPAALSFFWSVILALVVLFVGLWLIKVINKNIIKPNKISGIIN